MGDSVVHNKIIKSVCKDILLPAGIFQKGTSRVYFDDNGYFLTMIEFQPSSWSCGTYLNIGLSFLWYERDYFAYDFSPFTAARATDYVEYQNDEQFGHAVKQYAEAALQHALNFRNLRNIDYAKQYFEKWDQKGDRGKHLKCFISSIPVRYNQRLNGRENFGIANRL